MAVGEDWHWGKQYPTPNKDFEYDVPTFHPVPPITAFDNIQYEDFLNIVKTLWEDGHPDVQFQRYSARNQYNPDKGYIVASMARRIAADNNSKPRFRASEDQADGSVTQYYTQSFINLVRFTALHTDPEVADEMISQFESFMVSIRPILGIKGAERLTFVERSADEDETRMGWDRSARTLMYELVTQSIYTVNTGTLEKYQIKLLMAVDATPSTFLNHESK